METCPVRWHVTSREGQPEGVCPTEYNKRLVIVVVESSDSATTVRSREALCAPKQKAPESGALGKCLTCGDSLRERLQRFIAAVVMLEYRDQPRDGQDRLDLGDIGQHQPAAGVFDGG